MSSNKAPTDPDEIMRQKKAAMRAQYAAASNDVARPPAFNPEYMEEQQQHNYDQFSDDHIDGLEEVARPPPTVPADPVVSNDHNDDTKLPGGSGKQQQQQQQQQQQAPEFSNTNTSQLPQTMELINDKMLPTANVVPIAAEVVPNQEGGAVIGSGTGVVVGVGGATTTDNKNDVYINEEEKRKNEQRNKRLKLLLVAAVIVAVGAVGVAVGVVMSKSSNNNDSSNNNTNDVSGNDPSSPSSSPPAPTPPSPSSPTPAAVADIAQPIKCGIPALVGDTSADSFYNGFYKEPSCGTVAASTNTQGNRGAWWSITGDGSCVTLSTCDQETGFDTRIRVFEQDANGNRVCTAGNDDALVGTSAYESSSSSLSSYCQLGTLQSLVSFQTTFANLYYIFVDGFGNNDSGFFVMSIDCTETCKKPVAVATTPQPPTPQPTPAPVKVKFPTPGLPLKPVLSPGGKPNVLPTIVTIPTPQVVSTAEPSNGPPTNSPTELDIFLSGAWSRVKRVNALAACCIGETLSFSLNTRVLAVSSPFAGWGGESSVGTVDIYRRGFVESDGDNRKLQSSSTVTLTDDWIKVGSTLHGESSGENFGRNIALSGNGTIFVITNDTHVHTYRVYTNFWQKLDDTLVAAGGKVALSSDASVLAVSEYASSVGSVRTYRFMGGKWKGFGGKITTIPSNRRVSSMEISGDGTILAFGIDGHGASAYYRPPNSDNWGKFATLSSNTNGFGVSLALSDNGRVLAVGGYGNVKTFDLDGQYNFWDAKGPDIPYFENGGAGLDEASLSLSADGSVLVLGNRDEDYNYEIDNLMNVGMALVYRYYNDMPWEKKWLQVGGDLKETLIATEFGHKVVLSADGTELAVAAYCDGGCTFIYRLGARPETGGTVSTVGGA